MFKKYKKFIYMFLILALLFLIVHFILYFQYEKQFDKQNVYIKKKTKDYEYVISTVKTGDKNVDSEIKKYSKDKIKLASSKNNYKINISYTKSKHNDITTYDFTELEYSNNKKVREEHKIYNIRNKKLLELQDIFDKNTEYKSYIKERLYYKTIAYVSQNNINIEEKELNKKIDKLNNYIIKEDGISFIVYLDENSNKVEYNFDYAHLQNFLNKAFKEKLNVSLKLERKSRNIEELKDKNVIAITFDDGPSEKTTPRLLEELDKRGVKATFFVVGSNVEKNQDLIKKMYLDGHDIGIHTYSHSNLTKLSDDQIYNEKVSVINLIKSIIDYEPIMIRPPYGSIDSRVKNIYPMKNILWNVDSLDWKTRDVEAVFNEIIKNTDDGDIVLLHDLYDTSVDGALKSIDKLIKDGYVFVTVSELLQIKGDTKDTYSGF